MAIVYRVEQLTKIYKRSDKKANDQLTFNIIEGEIFGLLGPNGAGKSTLVNQLTGLVRPTTGAISLFGIDVVQHPAAIPDYVALQPQHSRALDNLYPEEALQFTAQLRGAAAALAHRQTDALMEEFALDSLRRRRLNQLSGGQRQLVMVAIALIGDRAVRVFDEPTNNLDPAVRKQVWDKLLGLNRQGATIILVTHNVLEAERVIQRVGIINHGRILALGTPGELKARINQRVQLQLLLKSDCSGYGSLIGLLAGARAISQQHWNVQCRPDQLQSTINCILTQVGLERLDDFRILTPSLEDVYLQLGGNTTLE